MRKLIKHAIAILRYLLMIATIVLNAYLTIETFKTDITIMFVIGCAGIASTIILTSVVVKHGYNDIKSFFTNK